MKTFLPELNDGVGASVDSAVVPLIKFLNGFPGVKTVSSRIGNDGCFVAVMGDGFQSLVDCLFVHVQPMIRHLDGSMVEVFFSGGWIGIIRFTKSQLDQILK